MLVDKNLTKVAHKFRVGTEQISVECGVGLEEPLLKLLSYSVCPVVDSVEVAMGEARVQGKVVIKVVYMTADNQISCKESVCDFSNNYTNSAIDPSLKLIVCSKLCDSSLAVVSENNLKVTAIIELSFTAIKQEDINMLSGAGEDVCIKMAKTKVVSLAGDNTQTFEENLTINIKDKFEKLISVNTEVVVKDVTSGNNFVSVSGEIVTRALFLSDSETGKICVLNNAESFKQEIEASGISTTSEVEAYLYVQADQVKKEVVTGENGTVLNLNVPVKAFVIGYDEKEVDCAEDLYSLKNHTETVTESFKKVKISAPEYFESKIEGGLTLSDAQPRVDKIIAISSPYLIQTNSYVKDGEITLEGVAYANVIYLNDEEMTTNSIQVEIPFTVSDKTQAPEESEICAQQVLDNVDVIVKKGRELFFDAKVKSCVNYYHNDDDAVISDLTIGDELPEKDCAIEIYFGKEGNSLWDIAKSLGISTEMLKQQNNDIPDVLENDVNLTIYYQKNR